MKLFILASCVSCVLALFNAVDPVIFAKEYAFHYFRYKYSWTEEWLHNVDVDHFSFTNNQTFSLRYFINDAYFHCNGPIFFYTGNEGSLEGFAMNTGFMYDSAPLHRATLVFAEHRFYGKTKPFGNDSYADVKNLGYLSSEQALADYAALIDYLRNTRLKCATDSPIIAFGGSYGGMLAAWLRAKYPDAVIGAIASSAPVKWFEKAMKPDLYNGFDRVTTRTFLSSGCKFDAVTNAFKSIEELAKTEEGRTYLNDAFKLEEKSFLSKTEDYLWLRQFIREAMSTMAMVDYPYPASFLHDLPAWPVNRACRFLKQTEDDPKKAVKQLYEVVNIFYNTTREVRKLCANPAFCDGAFSRLGDPLGWPWQTCTEMVMPMCSDGPPNDFFWKECPFDFSENAKTCEALFEAIGYTKGLYRKNWAMINYGTTYKAASNIIFANGALDPWSIGGYKLKNEYDTPVESIILKQGAHHYDLRGRHPADTKEVIQVRNYYNSRIKLWLKLDTLKKLKKNPQHDQF